MIHPSIPYFCALLERVYSGSIYAVERFPAAYRGPPVQTTRLVKPYDTAIIEISEENLQGEKNTITVIHYESLNNS